MSPGVRFGKRSKTRVVNFITLVLETGAIALLGLACQIIRCSTLAQLELCLNYPNQTFDDGAVQEGA